MTALSNVVHGLKSGRYVYPGSVEYIVIRGFTSREDLDGRHKSGRKIAWIELEDTDGKRSVQTAQSLARQILGEEAK